MHQHARRLYQTDQLKRAAGKRQIATEGEIPIFRAVSISINMGVDATRCVLKFVWLWVVVGGGVCYAVTAMYALSDFAWR